MCVGKDVLSGLMGAKIPAEATSTSKPVSAIIQLVFRKETEID